MNAIVTYLRQNFAFVLFAAIGVLSLGPAYWLNLRLEAQLPQTIRIELRSPFRSMQVFGQSGRPVELSFDSRKTVLLAAFAEQVGAQDMAALSALAHAHPESRIVLFLGKSPTLPSRFEQPVAFEIYYSPDARAWLENGIEAVPLVVGLAPGGEVAGRWPSVTAPDDAREQEDWLRGAAALQ